MSLNSPETIDVVCDFAAAPGGATTSAGTIQCNDRDGNPIGKVCTILVDLGDTEYLGPNDAATNATMATATKGTILGGSGTSRLVVQTDDTGLFAATITDAADEEVFVTARTVEGGMADLAHAAIVHGCVPNSVTFAA